MTSIIMLVHNAVEYTRNTIETLQGTKGEWELIVVDNASDKKTRKMLYKMYEMKKINKLLMLDKNTLFAKGNNLGVKLCDSKSEKILLLNSDIDIRNKEWLSEMEKRYEKGVFTLGVCENDPHVRVDGYCFMIDKDLYTQYLLDENYEWWWSITKLQAQVLQAGHSVKGVKNCTNLIFHYGGMSGPDYKNAKGMEIELKQVQEWFGDKEIDIIEEIDNMHMDYNPKSRANKMFNKEVRKNSNYKKIG